MRTPTTVKNLGNGKIAVNHTPHSEAQLAKMSPERAAQCRRQDKMIMSATTIEEFKAAVFLGGRIPQSATVTVKNGGAV